MSFQPHYHVQSGGFSFDPTSSRPTAKPLNAGIFRPPAPSPSASAYGTGSVYSDISMTNTTATSTAKRKRRNTIRRDSTPMGWNMDMDGADDAREDDRNRQHRYTLAGQIHATPLGPPHGAENGLLEDSVYSDIDYRRRLGPTKLEDDETESSPAHHLALVQPQASTSTGWSFFAPLSTIGSVVGKVWEFCTKGAFKGFHAGGGTGYTVNGSTIIEETGQPWRTENPLPTPPSEELPEQRIPEPFPEISPQQEALPYSPFSSALGCRDSSSPDNTPQRPAAKRRQVSANNDELGNWVVVDQPANQNPRRFGSDAKAVPSITARTSSVRPRPGFHAQPSATTGRRINVPSSRFTGGTPPIRQNPRATAAAAAARPSVRTPHAGSPSLPPREPASFASPRPSTATHGTPSRIPAPIPLNYHQSNNPYTSAAPLLTSPTSAVIPSSASRPSSRQSPRHSHHNLASSRPISPTKASATSGIHRRNQSAASAASTANRRHSLLTVVDPEEIKASPRLDAEAKVLATRKLAAERDTDAKVDAFNAQLMAMIRQAKEALGTKVEVMEMDDGDDDGLNGGAGGWEDDDI
ncbi:hypothetical protein QBC35DRAFT_382887 [Podospora australis]|uniref:Uncharacterized protein n=1 Tax=Podospora australis TaxID=1536484 RepID=A0AAN6WVA4_9PEZI|nr:hypothetical protein QBC35DRAFT_382887 [Podospora australis]